MRHSRSVTRRDCRTRDSSALVECGHKAIEPQDATRATEVTKHRGPLPQGFEELPSRQFTPTRSYLWADCPSGYCASIEGGRAGRACLSSAPLRDSDDIYNSGNPGIGVLFWATPGAYAVTQPLGSISSPGSTTCSTCSLPCRRMGAWCPT